jgi:UDP-N-acetyl-D-glucosamine dehydrogenase
LSYKANVDDDRESPGYVLLELLSNAGAEVAYYDPYIPVIKHTREHARWAGTTSTQWNQAAIESFDLAVVSTAHANVNYQELVN